MTYADSPTTDYHDDFPFYLTSPHGRALAADDDGTEVAILHSAECRADHDRGVRDLCDCPFSRALDVGCDEPTWDDWFDTPVVLGVDPVSGKLTVIREWFGE